MNRKWLKNMEAALLAGLLMSMLVGAVCAFAQDCDDLRGDVLRLHILANSDQAFDQQIKLEVRDRILSELGNACASYQGKAQAQATLLSLLPEIESIAREVIQDNGYTYPVTAQVVQMYFDMRTYGNLTMPAGVYDAVRVSIGEGAGHNWWCVLYPPVCVSSAADMSGLQDESVAGKDPVFEPRFKIVEWIERLKQSRDIDNQEVEKALEEK